MQVRTTKSYVRWLVWAVILVCLYTGGTLIHGLTERVSDAEQAQASDRSDYRRALTDSNAKVEALANQLRELGKTPIVSGAPVAIPGPQGPGPTRSQIAVALQEYCLSRGGCVGPRGKPGVDGAASIIAGPPGPAGEKGEKGDTGSPCPDGTSMQETQVMTSLLDTTTIYACR